MDSNPYTVVPERQSVSNLISVPYSDGFDDKKHGPRVWEFPLALISLIGSVIGTAAMCTYWFMIFFIPWPVFSLVGSCLALASCRYKKSTQGLTTSAVVFAALSTAGSIACVPVIGILSTLCGDHYDDDYEKSTYKNHESENGLCDYLIPMLAGGVILGISQIGTLVVASFERHRHIQWMAVVPAKQQIVYIVIPPGQTMPTLPNGPVYTLQPGPEGSPYVLHPVV